MNEIIVRTKTVADILNNKPLVAERGVNFLKPVCVITPVVCADGFTMSVQASDFHYCSPRESVGPWHQVEVGFPSAPPTCFLEYAKDLANPTATVYDYVPIELVQQEADLHGGIVSGGEAL